MSEAWFTSDVAQYFAWTGLLSFTALAAPIIQRGQQRRLVLTLWTAIIALGLILSGFGSFAFLQHQPFHVTGPLLITGLLMAAGYAFSLIFVLRAYRAAERRKIAARDL